MKYLIAVLLGIIIGISGEWLIPKRYQVEVTHQCLKQKHNPNLTFLLKTDIFESDIKKEFPLYGDETIQSYEILYEFLTGDLIKLSQDQCNKVKEAILDNK